MVLTICSVYLGVSPPGWVSTRNQFTCGSCHMTICPSRMCPLLVRSTLLSLHVWFCLLGSLSNWVFVYLNSVHLEGLATWHSSHVGLCPLLILSTLLSAHVWFCLLGSLSNWVLVYLNSVYFGSLATWYSAHVVLCPLLLLSTLDSANVWLILLGILSTWVFVYLEFVLLRA